MQKRLLLALLLALTLILSGCSLVVKDKAVDEATEIVRLGDTVYTKKEVLAKVDDELYDEYMNAYYMYYFGLSNGYFDPTDPANIARAKETVVQNLTEEAVQLNKAKALGLDVMTAEDEAEIASRTDTDWTTLLGQAKSQLFAETTLEGDELDAAILASVTDLGYSPERYESDNRKDLILEKLRAYGLEDMPAITEEDLQAELDSHVESAKSTYATSPASYGNAVLSGTTVYYRPAGYRTVQQVLISFEEADQASMTDLKSRITTAENSVKDLNEQIDAIASGTDLATLSEASATDLAKLNADLETAAAELESLNGELAGLTEAAFARIDATADDVVARLQNGEDIKALAEEFSGDKSTDGKVNNPDGYPVSADMTRYDAAFKEGAMALANVGDISGKIRGAYGYYILKYTADVEEGPVSLDEVREPITEEVTTEKEDAYYAEKLAQWVKESGVKVDRKALDD